MGWASGQRLMQELITALKLADVPAAKRRLVYVQMIKAFEGHDCDTLGGCRGQDDVYDDVYGKLYPDDDEEPATEG